MSLLKGRLSCRSTLVQINESFSWDDMEVELGVILGTVVGDAVGVIGEDEGCIVREGVILYFDGE